MRVSKKIIKSKKLEKSNDEKEYLYQSHFGIFFSETKRLMFST